MRIQCVFWGWSPLNPTCGIVKARNSRVWAVWAIHHHQGSLAMHCGGACSKASQSFSRCLVEDGGRCCTCCTAAAPRLPWAVLYFSLQAEIGTWGQGFVLGAKPEVKRLWQCHWCDSCMLVNPWRTRGHVLSHVPTSRIAIYSHCTWWR